ncbi:hypothetical protein CLV51_103698 [Chitinophaga niastensis]|uniref:Uncharacterized protein n=1 Tax=Chitinophaga niastensis TaxID=536980 RepID=A0A2P8HKI2_CHINA|nr:hypothetical protein [Chitinophaga niastensis]PSL46717.1 hypothetical protein CLV51_103698 [Chitinophaga niastensis]
MKIYIVILIVTLFAGIPAIGQRLSLGDKNAFDTGYFFIHGGCKVLVRVPVALYSRPDSTDVAGVRVFIRKTQHQQVPAHVPFLSVKGSVLYDFYYQSHVDTPYTERDIYQHTIQTNLSVTVKNRYPFRVAFSTQAGNSSLFRNLTGARFSYTNRDFKNLLLSNAKNWNRVKMKQQVELDTLKEYADRLNNRISGLSSQANAPALLQRLIEARERALLAKRDSLSGKVSGINKEDSLYHAMLADVDAHKQQIDSLEQELNKVHRRYELLAVKMNRQKANLMDVLQHSRNNKELSDALGDMNLPDSVLPKGFRTLLAIRSFGIGRTMADYSELTAKNISITGVQVEYNPSYYLAVASGVVDYRFRNFIVREQRSPQYINLLRGGIGMKEDNHVFLTYYTGKKQLYGANAITQDQPVDNHLMGMALEVQWKLGKNTFLITEAAKSSLPFNARKEHNESNFNSMLNFSGHTNEAYTATFNTLINRSQTRISSMYKWMGNNFQSFSLYTTGSRQIAWNIQAEQPFFRQRLLVTGSIRKNDYATFYQPSNYESNTVFKSLQVSLRIPHWPVINLGYQPSSQLVKLDDTHYTENLFYMLTGTATHTYKYHGTMMNSMLTYSRFYNRKTDTAFVYFNSRNILASHTVFLEKFTLGGQASAALTQEYSLYNVTGEVSWKALSWLEIGGALKYNRQTVYNLQQWGYGGNSRMHIPNVGEIALHADKSFLPGSGKQLVSNNTGRLTYTRIF